MWEFGLEVLQNMCQYGTTAEQKGMTPSLINKIESFEFVFVLHMMIQGSLMGYQMLYSRKIKTLLTPWPLLIP